MARRGENIRKRKDGRWEARYRVTNPVTGEITYKSVYGRTYSEVKEKRIAYICNQEKKEPEEEDDLSFNELLTLWLNASRYRLKGSTQAKYEYMISAHIAPVLGDIKLKNLSTALLDEFMAQKLSEGRKNESGGLSESYVRTMMLVIHSAIEYGCQENLCDLPRIQVHKPLRTKPEITILNESSQEKLTNWLILHPSPTSLGILISLYAGLRVSEVCALKWSDIDFEQKILNVHNTLARVKNPDTSDGSRSILCVTTPKSRASIRSIPLPDFLLQIAQKIHSESSSEYVISYTASYVNPRTYENRFHKALRNCGIESINYHALRHTFASQCISYGMDVKTLSEMLGHTDVSITLNTYVHSSMDAKRKQLNKISRKYDDLYLGENSNNQ